MDFVLHTLILAGLYVILAVSLNLVSGYAGLVSVAHAAFYGVGAYVAALMALNVPTPSALNIAAAAVAGALCSVLVGVPSLRLRDDYFVILSFAFQVVLFSILTNCVSLTGGPMGLPGIPRPALFGCQVSSQVSFVVLVGVICLTAIWVCRRTVNSAFGRVLGAIREDETFAQACGKRVATYKVTVFAVGAGMAAVAGALYAYYVSFIDPTSFTVMESIFVLSIVIIGGAGNLWGSVVGAVVLVSLPELLRLLGLPSTVAANVRQMLYGALLVAFMMWRPQGLLGEYAFQKREADA